MHYKHENKEIDSHVVLFTSARGDVYVFICELRSDWLPNGPLEANGLTLSKRPAEALCF